MRLRFFSPTLYCRDNLEPLGRKSIGALADPFLNGWGDWPPTDSVSRGCGGGRADLDEAEVRQEWLLFSMFSTSRSRRQMRVALL